MQTAIFCRTDMHMWANMSKIIRAELQNLQFCNSARIILTKLTHIYISVLHIIAECRIADSAILQFCTNYFGHISSYMHICFAYYSRIQNCRIADSAILLFCTNHFDQISSKYVYLLCWLLQECRIADICNCVRIILTKLAHICISFLHIIAECRIADSAILQFCTNYFNQISPYMHICSAYYIRIQNCSFCNSANLHELFWPN